MSRPMHRLFTDGSLSVELPDLADFLSNPASYPHAPDHVRLIQTHASWVAVASPWVYKVKKPVDLGFLNFSTLELRKHFCEEEVRLNRRLCSRIYEGVVPITRHGGAIMFGGEGKPVEYAVRMRELEDGYFLHQLLAHDGYEHDLLEPVIETLGPFYLGQAASPDVSEWGQPERLRVSTDENFEQTEPYVGSAIHRAAFEAIRQYTNHFYDVQDELLRRRCTEGRILDCHGDLHTQHIHLSPDELCIYDCIEFNERFRYIDVASDIAFLAMDLDFQRHPKLSRYFVSRMADVIDDPALPFLADFYKCYRAYVRGKVESMRAAEPGVPPADQEKSRERARRYFQLALRYALGGSDPVVLVVMGGIGTGKSTQARHLAGLLDLPVVSSDRVRKELAGVPLYERGDVETRRRLYGPDLTARTYAALMQHALEYAAEGQGCILDATYSKAADRIALRQALNDAGITVRFIELTAHDETVRTRLEARNHSDQEISDARLEDLHVIMEGYEPPVAQKDVDLIRTSSDSDPEQTTADVLSRLAIERAHLPGPLLAAERM